MLGLLEKHSDSGNIFNEKIDQMEEDAILNDSDPDPKKQEVSTIARVELLPRRLSFSCALRRMRACRTM